jgi:hypothetical protein
MRKSLIMAVLMSILCYSNSLFGQNKWFTKQDSLAIVMIARFAATAFNS